ALIFLKNLLQCDLQGGGRKDEAMPNTIPLSRFRRETPDLLVEANHRIANQLALLAGLVRSQIETVLLGPALLTSDKVTYLLRDTAARIAAVGHLHHRMTAPQQGQFINLGDFLIECHKQFASSLTLGERLGTILKIGPDCVVSTEQASMLAL